MQLTAAASSRAYKEVLFKINELFSNSVSTVGRGKTFDHLSCEKSCLLQTDYPMMVNQNKNDTDKKFKTFLNTNDPQVKIMLLRASYNACT